jgi:hypothetical protein
MTFDNENGAREIKVICTTPERVDWHTLSDFQQNLKARNDRDIERLCNQIKKHGGIEGKNE